MASCARRVLVRFWECLRFGFGISLSLPQQILSACAETLKQNLSAGGGPGSQVAERTPAVVGRR
jgi:hypothetical protein